MDIGKNRGPVSATGQKFGCLYIVTFSVNRTRPGGNYSLNFSGVHLKVGFFHRSIP
jgi:hypothetical protein